MWNALVYTLVAGAAAALTVVALEPAWIRAARDAGLVGRDMNKLGGREVAEAGGIWVVVGAAFGLLIVEALHRYLEGRLYMPATLFALISLLLLSALLGFIDDILGWKKGLPPWQRVAFMAPISLPLVVIKAGKSTLSLPLVGVVNLGLLYPLVAVPLGVLGAANAFNMIAGLNGLEAGMGLTLMLYTALYAKIKGVVFVPQAAAVMAAALLAFLAYNWYPARVFPGNALTYGVGAYYAALVIIGNMEKFGIALFSLYFLELLLFLRGLRHGVYKENFGRPQPDGSIKPPYNKVYSITHAAMVLAEKLFGKATERNTVALIILIENIIGLALITAALHGLI